MTPFLKQFRWLPVKFLIQKRIVPLTYLSRNGTAPQYLIGLLQPGSSSHGLRSVYQNQLNVPRSILKWVTAPLVCQNLNYGIHSL
jgi:hypothetical protein